jgi:beta-galactosidase GanA
MVNDKPFLMLSGELHNSSMGGFSYMRPIWKRMADASLNTVIASATWELVEPIEGKYDFALVDSMIIGARKENLKYSLTAGKAVARLILLPG